MEWINVNDRLPENDDMVLITLLGQYHHYALGFYSPLLGIWDASEYWAAKDYEITHWMPLPELPKQ